LPEPYRRVGRHCLKCCAAVEHGIDHSVRVELDGFDPHRFAVRRLERLGVELIHERGENQLFLRRVGHGQRGFGRRGGLFPAVSEPADYGKDGDAGADGCEQAADQHYQR
jgi:hypothetical protein